MPKPNGMVIPGAWNFNGASKKLIPLINPAQKITQKIAINFFIKFKYHLKWLGKNDRCHKGKLYLSIKPERHFLVIDNRLILH